MDFVPSFSNSNLTYIPANTTLTPTQFREAINVFFCFLAVEQHAIFYLLTGGAVFNPLLNRLRTRE
jgi:hypothetical protein